MKWPDWSPKELREAHDALAALPSDAWVRDEILVPGFMRSDKPEPADYLVGIGSKSDTLQVVRKLASDPRMRTVWTKLDKLEKDARAGQLGRVFELGKEIVCCGIAARAASSIVERLDSATRATWTECHQAIARAASELSTLLKPSPSMEPEFQNIAFMFKPAHFRAIADELYGHTHEFPMEATEREETPEEIAASEAAWDQGVDDLAYWLEQSMTHHPKVLSSDVLDRMAELASIAARNPPFVAPSDRTGKQVFMMSGTLLGYFQMFFGRPLDDVVSVIASVVTGQEVSPESVKMRRQRWKEHQLRTPK